MYASFEFPGFLPYIYHPFIRSAWAFLNGCGECALENPILLVWSVF